MVEQQFDTEYSIFIFTPSLISLILSSLLLINFLFISKHLQTFMYHKLSTTLAFFDVIQQIGTILSAPFLLSADKDKCAYREYLFLFGSFCKTLTVLYISGTISYVIHYSAVPTYNLMRRVVIGFGIFTSMCFIFLPLYNAQATLCSDPTAGNFRLSSVDQSSRAAFVLAYLLPIVFCYFVNIVLIIYTAVRLRSMFNSALMKLLVRLLPGPVIFTLALLPTSLFQTVVLLRDRHTSALKVLALLGMNLSGALYASFYCYELLRDDMFVGTALKPGKPGEGAGHVFSDRARLRQGGSGGGAEVDSAWNEKKSAGVTVSQRIRGSGASSSRRGDDGDGDGDGYGDGDGETEVDGEEVDYYGGLEFESSVAGRESSFMMELERELELDQK